MTTGELARGLGVDRSRLTDYRAGGRPSVATARRAALLFRVDPVAVLVAGGLLTAEEAGLRRARPDPAELGDDELIAELRRRVKK